VSPLELAETIPTPFVFLTATILGGFGTSLNPRPTFVTSTDPIEVPSKLATSVTSGLSGIIKSGAIM